MLKVFWKTLLVSLGLSTLLALNFVPALGKSASSSAGKTQRWCQRIVPRINGLVNNSSIILANRQNWVTRRKTNLQNRINKYSSKGLDVTKLTADFKTYSGMLDQWISDYQTLIADLKASQQFTCGNSDGQFASAVKTANTQQKTVKADRRAFQSFFTSTLKLDFQTLAQQLRAMRLTGTPVPTH